MKLRTLVLLLILLAIAVFAALNWNTFNAPTDLSLGVTTVRVPLGLLMLGLLILLTLLFLLYVVYLQTSSLLESRRLSKEVQAHRELADQAEASRFTELRQFLEAELSKHAALHAESRAAVLARVEQLAQELHTAVEQSGNTLSAYIGELEERLEQGGKSGN
jgi:Na+-transporting methylmalonyl-CoA/oxaloacetate decarboxylase gamma subunit